MELELWRKEVTCTVRMRKRAPRRSELRRIGRWNVVLGFKCVKYTRANELKQKFFCKIGSTVSPELKKLIRDGKCLVKFLIFLRLLRVTFICRCIEFAFHAASLLNWNSLFYRGIDLKLELICCLYRRKVLNVIKITWEIYREVLDYDYITNRKRDYTLCHN